MTTVERKTVAELERNFVESFERLHRANTLYDAGHLSEAPDIAKEVFSLVDPKKGLLKHLGCLDIDCVSTAQPMTPGNLCPEYRLIDATISFDGMGYEPFLEKGHYETACPLEQWKDEIVLAWAGQESIKRFELIEFIRHVEGGGHISGQYERRWSEKMMGLMRGDYIDGHMVFGDGPPMEPENAHAPAFATVRQIGWEMEETLIRALPHLVERADFNPKPGPRMKLIEP